MKSIKTIGFSPEQLSDEPAQQRPLTQRDVIAHEQLHLLLSKVRMLCMERLSREGLNHLYEIADIGYRISQRLRAGNEYQAQYDSNTTCLLGRYDSELLLLNSLLYQRLDPEAMYERQTTTWLRLGKKKAPVILLVVICSTVSFILGSAIS